MANTVIGVYDNYGEAQAAQNDLLASGFSRTDVSLSPSDESPDVRQHALTSDQHTSDTGGGIGGFFRNLFGMDDKHEDAGLYSEAVRRGSYLVTVNAIDDDQRDLATNIMNRHDPVDIDERSAQWKSQGWAGYDASAPALSSDELARERSARTSTMPQSLSTGQSTGQSTGLGQSTATTASGDLTQGQSTRTTTNVENEISIPVIQEEIAVGKREVQRGGVRVYQRVTETPVNETVQLREEHVTIERHPVNQPASEADMAAFTDASFEVRETAEEAVVAKTARIVEEVVVNKEVTEQAAQISDTVRRSDVEVEKIPASQTMTSTSTTSAGLSGDDEFRHHWQTSYGSSGGRYEDYAPAYQYGSQLASSDRFKGHDWATSESEIRSDYETRHPGSTWDKVKDSVRFGWERMTK